MAGLVACGDEADVRGGDIESLNGFDDVDDCGARADADVLGLGVEVVFYGADSSIAFGSFDISHWGLRGGVDRFSVRDNGVMCLMGC